MNSCLMSGYPLDVWLLWLFEDRCDFELLVLLEILELLDVLLPEDFLDFVLALEVPVLRRPHGVPPFLRGLHWFKLHFSKTNTHTHVTI